MGRKKLLPNRADLILQAAEELFAERSYQKTTLDEIAERAAIGKGSIYLEFSSKEEILFALISQQKAEELEEMRRFVAQASKETLKAGALETLKALLLKQVGAIYDSINRKQRSPEEVIQSRERLRERLKPFLDARLQLIVELLERAQQQNEIRPQKDFHRTAQLIMMSLRAVLPPYDSQANKLKLQHDAAEILELIFEGLS
jgi:AcrR family transcriptional regulator